MKQTIDNEQVEVIETEALTAPQSLAMDLHDQTDRGTALLEERVRGAKRQLAAALKLAAPSQWMVYGDGDKRQLYATVGVADRILRFGFGMKWTNKKVVVVKDDQSVTATATGDLVDQTGKIYESFTGARRMVYNAERKGGVEGYIKDEPNLIKSALANMKHRAVTEILGLSFLSPADLKELGVDLDKLERKVEFQDHGDDSQADGARVPFGKNKGKLVAELGDKSLDWYVSAAQANIADPEKAKWQAKEQKWLDVLLAEQTRRVGIQTGSPQGEWDDIGPPPMGTQAK